MRRRNKAAKTRRRKRLTPKQRSASKAPHRNNFSPAREEKNVARLSRELNEAFEQQAATADILNIISSSPPDTQPVFEAIVQSVLKLFPDALISLALRYGDRINAAAVADHNPERAEAWRRTISRTPLSREYMHGVAMLDCKIVDIPDASRAPAEFSAGARNFLTSGNRAITIMPMMRRNEAIGLLSVVRRTPGPLSDKQLSLLRTFAAQAVIAIENTRLLNELRESLQQQTATADVLGVISRSAFDLQPVFETVGESAVRLCGADRAFIFRFDGEMLRCVVAYNAPPELESFIRQNPIRPGRGSGSGRAALARRTVHIRDVTIDPEYTLKSKDIAPVRTVLAVPILKGDDLLGVILTYRLEVNPFTDKQVALVEAFADQAAIAIENVRLFEAEQKRTRELSESLQQQTATADVLKVISRSTFDLQTVLQALIEVAARLCEADQGTIMRQQGSEFVRAANFGFPVEFTEVVRDLPMVPGQGSAAGRALLERRTIHIPDVQADANYTFLEGKKFGGYRTVLGVPMLREDVPIGVFALTRREVRPFTDKQIELVSTFADQAAIAMENVRLFESVEARTRELAESLEELRTTQDRLVQTQKLALLGQLTAGIAHEIKNPLNFVNNFSGISAELIDELQDTLRSASLDEKTRTEIEELTDTLKGNFDKVVHHGKRADAIVKNMLQHSREGSGEHRVIDINALVEESLNLAWHGARAETQGFEIKLKQSLDPSAGGADVFPQDIRRALLNLIANGFYAATKRRAETMGGDYDPTLTASTKNLGDHVEIRIHDNGTGIALDVKEKMFEPFFTTKPTGEGTGLGLSISHDIIVKQHAGTIEVDTRPGEFTEIRIVLPRAPQLI